jgi:yecA family protein
MLSDENVAELRDLLRRSCVPQGSLDLATFDGLLVACTSAPSYASSVSWFPLLYGMDEQETQQRLSTSAAGLEGFEKLIWRRFENIAQVLAEDRFEAFYAQAAQTLQEPCDGEMMDYAQRWCVGYLRGVILRRKEWEPLLGGCGEDRFFSAPMTVEAVCFLRSYATRCQSEMQILHAFQNDPKRSEIVACLPAAASALHHSWLAYKRAHTPTISVG